MTSQIRGMAKAIGNVNDAISMTQTAEGALSNVGDILQRMRELAVQAGTGTLNDSDRSSLQLEVAQLKQQIDDIANRTNHNNIKLLDGTAQNVTIQSGINSGDTMKIGFDSVKTKDIGIGSKAFLQSAVGTSATRAALVASSLYLNGVAVGASLSDDDTASPLAGKNTSAIAKAAAINRVANLSGVYARAEGNFVSGTLMTAASAASTGTVTINGVVTDQFSTSLDTSLTRKTVVNAINAISSQTGVTATDTGDDKTGVTLFAADGRNINLTLTTLKSATTGLKLSTATTYVGSYSLFTLDGRDITVGQAAGTVGTAPATVENTSGLQVGVYKADTAIFTSANRSTTTAAPSSSTTGLLYGNAMIINGVAVSAAVATDDTASWEGTGVVGGTSSTRSSSAIAIAAAINRSSAQSGVSAKAASNVLRGTGFTAATASVKNVFLNGVRFTVSTNTVDTVIDRFNEFSGQTGVTASRFGDGMQLEAADGRTIVIGSSAANTALGLTGVTIGSSGLGTSANAYVSSVQLTSDKAFTVQAGSLGNANLELLGFYQGTYGASKNGLKVAELDVSTISGATQAIAAVDSAINTVSAAQAKSGAINNRLDSVINNLSEGSKNMQASRSRILDTDYATETTNLAKQQIIQQAATAMLAQANQSSQSILSLLK
jgi:flagellin